MDRQMAKVQYSKTMIYTRPLSQLRHFSRLYYKTHKYYTTFFNQQQISTTEGITVRTLPSLV